jgi:hypothetical protein
MASEKLSKVYSTFKMSSLIDLEQNVMLVKTIRIVLILISKTKVRAGALSGSIPCVALMQLVMANFPFSER